MTPEANDPREVHTYLRFMKGPAVTTLTLRPDPADWDVAYVDAYLADLCERKPDRRNPVDSAGVCLYEAENDPTCHCLVGEMVYEHGLMTPEIATLYGGADDLTGDDYLPGLGGVVANRLVDWQTAADDGGAWGEVPPAVTV